MYGWDEFKQSRLYQEIKQEGREEGYLEGKAESYLEGKLESVPQLLAIGLTVEQIATALNLTVEQIQSANTNSQASVK